MNPYPSGWDVLPLADCGRWLSGGTPSTSNAEYWNGDIPWISAKSLTQFRLYDSERRVTAVGVANGTRIVDPDTILMVVRGMSLKSEFRMGIAQRKMAFGQDCKALIARDGIDASFLAYAVLAKTSHILSLVDEAGHGTGRLNTDQLRGVEIGVPSLPEQYEIAEILGALDDKIEANRKLAATADALAVALLTPFRPIVPLGTIARQVKISVNPVELADREVAHYSLPAFDLESTPESVQASAIKSNKYRIREPAVLVSKLNPRFPRVWNVPEVGGVPALASTEFVVLEPTICSTNVLWAMVQHPRFARALQSLVAGTSGSHQRVRPAEMLSALVPDPSAVPQPIKSRVDGVVQRSFAAGAEARTLRTLRDTLLPKLMSGALKVREAEPLVAQAV